MRSRTEIGSTRAVVFHLDGHGINTDDESLAHGRLGVRLQRLDLVFALGAVGVGKVLGPPAARGEIDHNAVGQAVRGNDTRH